MMAPVKRYWPSALAMAFGFSLAVVLAPVVLATVDWYRAWDEANNPPATLTWHTIERVDSDVLRIKLKVTRHEDCQMIRALGYSGMSIGEMQPAESFEREDGRAPQSYPVGITVISRPWVMRGVYGTKLAVSAYYDCEDRVVKAPLLVGDIP